MNRGDETCIRFAVLDDAPDIFRIFKNTNPAETTHRDKGIGLADVIDWIESATEQQPLFVLEQDLLSQDLLKQDLLSQDLLKQNFLSQDKSLQAWCSLAPFYGLPAFDKTLEISLYVTPECQQKGLGTALINHIEKQQETLGFTHLIAYVYASNLSSLSFFKKQRFEQWGLLPNIAESEGARESVVLLGRRF